MPQPRTGRAPWSGNAVLPLRLTAISLIAALLAGCAEPATAVTGFAALPGQAAPSAGDDYGLGARVLAFARAHLGRLVGGGQCAELADNALIAAGARTFSAYAGITRDDDYVWGRKVTLSDARPGDILQFRDFVAETSTRSASGESGSSDERPHHTAILEANLGDTLLVLEQNAAPDRSVRRNRVAIRSGTYEGLPTPDAVTTVLVTGTISVYRPEAAGAV